MVDLDLLEEFLFFLELSEMGRGMFLRFGFVVGVINWECIFIFECMFWWVCWGNVFL